jgi:hypothetical protein
MVFINEYVSESDVAAHDLDSLKAKYKPHAWRLGRPPGFRHQWTIDRARNCFLMEVENLPVVGSHGGSYISNTGIWLMRVQSRDYFFGLVRSADGSSSIADRPFLIIWELMKKPPPHCESEIDTAIRDLLQEALVAYGHAGARRQIEDSRVSFKF